jgi:hypothetical protein
VDDAELARACRPGSIADDLLREALERGSLDEHADTGDLVEGEADHIARIYTRRARHLAESALLLVDLDTLSDDLDRLRESADPVRVVVRTERVQGARVVYTAVGAGTPWRIRACLVHRLPDTAPTE